MSSAIASKRFSDEFALILDRTVKVVTSSGVYTGRVLAYNPSDYSLWLADVREESGKVYSKIFLAGGGISDQDRAMATFDGEGAKLGRDAGQSGEISVFQGRDDLAIELVRPRMVSRRGEGAQTMAQVRAADEDDSPSQRACGAFDASPVADMVPIGEIGAA